MQDRILHYLKKTEGYLSGEQFSRTFHISRAGIWKNMQELRKQGYDIVAVPHLGYKLISSPDKLLPFEIQGDLKTKILGKEVVHFDATPSTMDVAFQYGLDRYPEGTVICAESQTKGRGRLGRHWSSPKGKGLYASIILRPKVSPSQVAKLTLASAVAVSEAIYEVTKVKAAIKWPNDLMVNNKKLCGILTELQAEIDRVKFVVIGLGLNVNTSTSQLVEGATSLKNETNQSWSRVDVLKEILRRFEKWYLRIQKEGFDSVIERWKELSMTLNRRVRIVDPNGFIEGEAIDLDQDGGLLIRQDSGEIVKKLAGDVVLAH